MSDAGTHTPQPLGVGIVGLGKWSYQLGQAIRRSPQLTLLSCYTRTAEKREAYATTFGCAAVGTLGDLLYTPDLEAVILCTPAHAHHDLALACLQQGMHLFIEKPMALSVSNACLLIATARKQDVILMVGHEMRRLGSMRAAKRLVQEGALGRVVSAAGVFTLRGRFEPGNWRSHPHTNRGGALMQLGIHPIENLNYLFGRPRRVLGAFANALAPNGVHDVGSAIITYEDGVQATVNATYISPASQRLSLYGTRANLHQVIDMRVWPDAALADERTQLLLEDGEQQRPVPLSPRDVLVEQLEDFAASVRASSAPETGADEGLWALAVVEAALRSAETGRTLDPRQLIDDCQQKGA